MVTKLLSASALLAVAGVASGAAFQINTIDAGLAAGSLGAPITWSHTTNGAAYNNGAGSDNPPSPSLIDLSAAVGFDSYIAIDPVGPSTAHTTNNPPDGYQALGPGNIITPAGQSSVFGASGVNGSLGGVWFNANASGGFVTSGAGDRMFIAQISLRPNASAPTTAGILANIKDGGTISPDGSLGTIKFGLANASSNNGLWGQRYHLEAVGRTISGVSAAFNGGTSWAIYIVATPIPAPGAVGLAGLAGLAAIRRRR